MSERKCRICLEGDDPSLGRLIKPCKCDGSIRYVHILCLNRWRRSSISRSAFFQCPQCHYKYHFARTRIVGLATSPLLLAFFSLNLFILLVFASSFVASLFLTYFRLSDSDSNFSYSYWFYDPFTATRDLIASAVHIVDDLTSERLPVPDWSTPTPHKLAHSDPSLLIRLLRRFVHGLSIVGIISFLHWLWSMSLIGSMRFYGVRGLRDRRNRAPSILAILILAFVIAGAVRALLQVYHFVERKTKQLLVRAEYTILEVGD